MTKPRKYSVYKTLAAAVTRSGVKQAGVTTTLLLKTFLENEGILTAKAVEELGLCEAEGFKAWREPLVKAGWIQYDHEFARAVKKGSLHQPGRKLVPYLNREKIKNQELATKGDLEKVRGHNSKEIDTLRAEFEQRNREMSNELDGVKGLVKLIIARLDDPYTDEKFEDYSKHPEKMLRLISSQKA